MVRNLGTLASTSGNSSATKYRNKPSKKKREALTKRISETQEVNFTSTKKDDSKKLVVIDDQIPNNEVDEYDVVHSEDEIDNLNFNEQDNDDDTSK